MENQTSTRWRLPIELLGAAAGLAGLVYATGATTLWLRYATTDFPADLALSLTARERIVAIGFRILFTWAAGVSTTILVVTWLSRQASVRSAASSLRRRSRRVPILRSIRGRAAWTAVAMLAIVGSAFVTWSLLTTALVGVIAVTFFRKYGLPELSTDLPEHRAWWRLGVFITGAAAVLGIGWQLQVNLTYDHAKLYFKQPQRDWPQVTDAIYVGQANGAYYVAPRLEPGGPFDRSLVAVPANTLERFELLPDDQTLCTGVPRPIVSAGRVAENLWDTVRQHLSRTGQQVSPPSLPPPFTGHGRCPDP
jgi:hypothetical protein